MKYLIILLTLSLVSCNFPNYTLTTKGVEFSRCVCSKTFETPKKLVGITVDQDDGSLIIKCWNGEPITIKYNNYVEGCTKLEEKYTKLEEK